MNAPVSFTFSEKERLRKKKYIEELFKYGSFFRSGPFIIRYHSCADLENHQVLIAVPKKQVRKAVRRNRIKRQIREIYRLNKHILSESKPLLIGIIYLSKDEPVFETMKSKLIKGLERLQNHV